MAHHKSAKKRIKQDMIKRLRNRYYKKSTRTSDPEIEGNDG
jgi:small subunit ribosomal protein S20